MSDGFKPASSPPLRAAGYVVIVLFGLLIGLVVGVVIALSTGLVVPFC